ncbi:hypothetical protein C1O33_05435 [Staphylococcus schleiferi]|uniref:phage tail spike protein n=1 Tax=Staphylococcus sp. 191 TaxID=2070016 RepID=UPI0013F3E94C|nr:phage tail spike protein [Staphylococcus sp. 191]NHA36200.1 hypothetical protein [Staphylococcus schleiferi]NHB70543.1 hypothetical protein [Staphylococcus sp. 191]
MIHVMNFKGEIIDYISRDDNALVKAVHHRNINDRTETFDFTILSERTINMQERNRIIIQDKNGQYREFIIDHISQDIDGYTEIETVASYLEDIAKAKPYAPHKFEKMTTKQALSDVLKDTGWLVSDATEYGGIRTTSWMSYQTRYEVLLQLCTTYKMMVDFYIEIGSNSVEKRYVVLRKRQPLFNGKEITYGKDLTGLKRTVDYSEVKTALLCVGPEKEGGKRIELIVKDDDAQARIGLPGRYNWGIYEPETDDENMTEARLRTLGTTELNKRKKEAISYEVTALDIQKAYSHEVVNLGDMVRIKNRDFTPPLYVEAEVISEEYDMIAEDVVYGFGEYVEYREKGLRDEFTKKLDDIRSKLNDSISNINTIVKDSVDGQLQYFERKIFKSPTPPENPVNDMFWLDTSNPDVAVLRRYWNGKWIKSSPEKPEDIGAISREQALFSELKNTFINLNIQHARLLSEATQLLNSEYLVDMDLKGDLQASLDAVIDVYNQIKTNLESMTPETATIGKLVDTQALFLEYRKKLQDFYIDIEDVKIAIDERFKLLQSQYTDEKFNDAMTGIANVLPNGHWNPDTKQLTSDIPNKDDLEQLRQALILKQNEGLGSYNQKLEELQKEFKNLENGMELAVKKTIKEINSSDDEKAVYENIYTKITENSAKIQAFEDKIDLKANRDEITQTLNSQLEPLKNNIKQQASQIELLPDKLTETVSNKIYETTISGLVQRLAAEESKRETLANQINDTVSIQQYQAGIQEAKEYADEQLEDVANNPGIKAGIQKANEEAQESLKEYVRAQDELRVQEAQAYADGKVSEEEQRAIQDAQAKLEEAKQNAELKARNAEKKANAYTDGKVKESTDAQRKTLARYGTQIIQNGKDIKLRTTKEEFDATNRTLSNILSEIVQNITDGTTIRYDDNGVAQSLNVGPQGIQLNGDKINLNASRQFNLLVADMRNKVDKNSVVSSINASPERIDINTQNIGIRGGSGQSYVDIRNDQIELSGHFNRTWRGDTQRDYVYTRLKDGHLRFRNNNQNRSLYYSDFGISTYLDGEGDGSSGTLQFFDYTYSDNARGVTLNSSSGVVALRSDNNRVVLEASNTVNIESKNYSIYLRPMSSSRLGRNEFQFWVKDNDAARDTDGVLSYGSITSGSSYGSGIRFDKSANTNYVYATNNNGDIGTGDFYANRLLGDWTAKGDNVYACVDDKLRVTDKRGYNNGDPTYKDLQVKDIQANSMRVNTGANFYLGVTTGELRVTNNLLYNRGNIGYKPVRASAFNNASLAEYKKDIKLWNYDALSVITNDLELYQYKYKDDSDQLLHRGVVIGDGYATPSEFIFGDGVNLYEMLTWSLRAIQQLNDKINKLEEDINEQLTS